MQFGTHAPPLVCVLRLSYLLSLGGVVIASLWLFFISNFCAVTCLCDRVLNIRLFLCLWSGYAASRWMSRKLLNHAASFLNLSCFFSCSLPLSVDSSRSMASMWSLALMRKLWVHMQVFIFHKKNKTKLTHKLLCPPSLCPVIAQMPVLGRRRAHRCACIACFTRCSSKAAVHYIHLQLLKAHNEQFLLRRKGERQRIRGAFYGRLSHRQMLRRKQQGPPGSAKWRSCWQMFLSGEESVSLHA